MIKLIFSTLYFFSILGAFAKLHADKIEVAGYQFSPPEKWVSTPPSSKMRKAQFTVLGKDEKNEHWRSSTRIWIALYKPSRNIQFVMTATTAGGAFSSKE